MESNSEEASSEESSSEELGDEESGSDEVSSEESSDEGDRLDAFITLMSGLAVLDEHTTYDWEMDNGQSG